ncbi:MAG: DUF814 domain-containing protein [Nanoarchaeota archaeon]|nr:DUF814 domain-containing protein [Nanoarchaeota archaeon]
MKLTLDLKKSVEENASEYFEKAKKAKRKVKGAEEAVQKMYARLSKEEKRVKEAEEKRDELEAEKSRPKRKLEWYEKFRWFISSEGFLVIGGRDATTNEIIIKKHTEKNDLVFHTDMAGSPFFVIKNPDQKDIGNDTLIEVSDATCTYSRAWKLGLGTTNVFWVKPDQVSKEANPGEFMGKGAFMIRGKTNYLPAKISLAIGVMDDGRVMGAPVTAIKKHCKISFELMQGNEKTAAVAKKIKSKLGDNSIDLDDIIKVIPAGGARIK